MSVQQPELKKRDVTLLQKRAERLRDYLEECLDSRDPLQANIGAAACEMSEVAARLKCLIDEILASADPSERLRRMEKYASVFDMYFKSMRQAERYMQLDKRLAGGRPNSNKSRGK